MSLQIMMSHPFGNANVKQTAQAFAEANMLAEYWTAIGWDECNRFNAILPRPIKRELMRRSYPSTVAGLTQYFPWYEVARLLAPKLGGRRFVAREIGLLSLVNCHLALDRHVAKKILCRPQLDGVYAYDHCALSSFNAARRNDVKCIYDLPTGYWRLLQKITLEEIELQPDWCGTAPSLNFPEDVFNRKDEELLLANHVIVASHFTKVSLQLLPQMTAPVSVIPYGAPPPLAHRLVNESKNKKLRVLYVGSMGMMKGLPYLLGAIDRLDSKVELTLIGRPTGKCATLDRALQKYRWIPSLPHAAILSEMALQDVFVFPSLFEGFGLVILEALSRGLPVITTPNTGGPDVLTDGADGFIVPIRSSDAIIEKLQLLIDDRVLLAQMSAAALRKAADCSWASYRHDLVSVVQHALKQKKHAS